MPLRPDRDVSAAPPKSDPVAPSAPITFSNTSTRPPLAARCVDDAAPPQPATTPPASAIPSRPALNACVLDHPPPWGADPYKPRASPRTWPTWATRPSSDMPRRMSDPHHNPLTPAPH